MRPTSPLLGLVLLALATTALASGLYPPAEAETATGENGVRAAYWVGTAERAAVDDVAPGGSGALWFAVTKAPLGENGTPEDTQLIWVNVTSDEASFENASLFTNVSRAVSLDWIFLNTSFFIPEEATTRARYNWTVETYAFDNATGNVTLLASFGGSAAIGVQTIEVPAPPTGIPTTWLVGGGAAVLVLAGGAALYAQKQRKERRAMRGRTRSQALRETELEQKLEKAPEAERAVVQAEIRQVEKARETRRDLQILEAKRADAIKTLDLLKKRHEMGGLTKLQYDNMAAKKQADLERIEREIAEMESQGDGASAA